MKKLNRLFVNKSFVRQLLAKKIFGFAVAAAALGLMAAQAQAQIIIQDNFTSGSQYGTHMDGVAGSTGLSPSGTNLPGGTWQLAGAGLDGATETKNTNLFNTSNDIGTVADYARLHNGTASAISLMSTGSYVEPDTLTFAATVNPQVGSGSNNSGGATSEGLMGFYSTTSASNYGAGGKILGVGLTSTGSLNFEDPTTGQSASGIAAGTGIFDANGFTTLSFELTYTASVASPGLGTYEISDIVLDGVDYSQTHTTGLLTQNYLNYAGVTSNVNPGYSAYTNLTISEVESESVVPEPSTYVLFLAGGALLGLHQLRRRQCE